ncbi:MAG TPA: sulfotransferase [Rhizomicrobium sp.]|jgi:tetratricopeptide (TPR) repeat protein
MTKETQSGQEPGGQTRNVGSPAAPQSAQQQYRRGVQLLQSGQVAAAMPLLLAAILADGNHFDAHHALAVGLMRSGRFADAGRILARAVTLRPGSAPAWRDLGTSYDRQNLHEQAIEAYRRAVELEPKLADVHRRLGELYAMYSRNEEAGDSYDRAADVEPDATNARLYRSDALLLRSDISAAERRAREAVALEPASFAANGALAGLLYAQGRFEDATTCFETALRLNPKAAQCWDGLVHCRRFSESDNSILDRMRAVLRRDDLNDSERMTIQFAMGKVYDDCGEYAHAMEQFDAANRLRAQDLTFDRANFAALVDRNIQRFTPDFIARKAASGARDSKPLFIVGMYRSGTTLAEQIVSSHPDIAAGGELTVWTPADIEIDAATGEFDAERARAAIAKYLSVLQKIRPSAARVSDKLPFNWFRLGAIHSLMPNARIIHCRRDAIDTCLSIYSTLFRSRVSFAARKDDLAFCYRQYLRMMDHWRKVLPAEIFLDVQYERLIADREAETRRLIAFTGLDWNDGCLRPEQNERSIKTSSAWQARQPVYATSLQRWRCYEPWLGELRQLLPPGEQTGTPP